MTVLSYFREKFGFRKLDSPAYEGTAKTRRLLNWGLSSYGPSSSVVSSLSALRSRSRDLCRNSPWIAGGVQTYVASVVGKGITPRWSIEDQDLKAEIQDLWSEWAKEADADGMCDFLSMQSLVMRAVIESGECVVRLRVRPADWGLTVPLQLQLIEGDHLDETFDSLSRTGMRISAGIEYNRVGRRIAYHLWKVHPDESLNWSSGSNVERVRVPAEYVCHVFRPLRPGQQRGVPWMAPVLPRMRHLDQLEDAELERRKSAAMFLGFLTKPLPEFDESAGTGLGPMAADDDGSGYHVSMEPGTVTELLPGESMEFSRPPDAGDGYRELVEAQLRAVAKGLGITYEMLTGDLSEVNFSSIRAGQGDFKRAAKQIQDMISFQFCRPVAETWLDLAVSSGALSIPDYAEDKRKYRRISWRPDRWEFVTPTQDVAAEVNAIRAGLKSRDQVVAEMGRDAESLDAEIAEGNERADAMGLIFDSDPRWTTTGGQHQQDNEEGDEDADAEQE